jgi:hypothetical protein
MDLTDYFTNKIISLFDPTYESALVCEIDQYVKGANQRNIAFQDRIDGDSAQYVALAISLKNQACGSAHPESCG